MARTGRGVRACRHRRLLVPGAPPAVGRRRPHDDALDGHARSKLRRRPRRRRTPRPVAGHRRPAMIDERADLQPVRPGVPRRPVPVLRPAARAEPGARRRRSASSCSPATTTSSRTLRGNEFSRDVEANADDRDATRSRSCAASAPRRDDGRGGQEHPQPRPARPHPPAPPRVAGVHAVGHRAAAAARRSSSSTTCSTGPPSGARWSSSTSSPSRCRSR